MAKQSPMELFNEKQESIFNTSLSSAADDHCKALLERDGWKEKCKTTEKALIGEMKKAKLTVLNLPQNRQIRYVYSEAKEKCIIKDVKAKTYKRKKF